MVFFNVLESTVDIWVCVKKKKKKEIEEIERNIKDVPVQVPIHIALLVQTPGVASILNNPHFYL